MHGKHWFRVRWCTGSRSQNVCKVSKFIGIKWIFWRFHFYLNPECSLELNDFIVEHSKECPSVESHTQFGSRINNLTLGNSPDYKIINNYHSQKLLLNFGQFYSRFLPLKKNSLVRYSKKPPEYYRIQQNPTTTVLFRDSSENEKSTIEYYITVFLNFEHLDSRLLFNYSRIPGSSIRGYSRDFQILSKSTLIKRVYRILSRQFYSRILFGQIWHLI